MSNFNTILIKRRTSGAGGAPSSLSGGEIAFNEVDSSLYYGSNSGVIAIGGSGAYVNRTTSQTIGGNKTLTGSTTLSSTTFSSDSLINAGGNKITNLGTPTANADAATKQYVDSAASGASSSTSSLSSEIYNTFVKLTDNRAVNLNGGGLTVAGGVNADSITTTGAVNVGTDLTVTGNLNVLGATTTLETTTTLTSAFSITNAGSQTALTVTQTGAQDVAVFTDAESGTALIVKDGGNVGIGTASPNAKLTVAGAVSATGAINGASTLGVTGATTLGSTLNVTGASTLNSTLGVTGAATFASSVSAQGALTIDGVSTLNGGVTVNNTLNTTGAVNFDSTLTVDGTSTLTGNVSAGANVIGVAGTSYLVDFIVDGGTF